jgi:hypothetical protein
MKSNTATGKVEPSKVASITVLSIMAILIILLGGLLTAISLIRNISFSVLNSNIHGSVFGIVIVFLGIRYVLSVRKLKKEVYKSTSNFSWDNFKSDKTKKPVKFKNEPILTKYWMKG